MPIILEKDIEKKLREKVAALGGHCLKWVCPGWSGVPDRIVLLPGGHIFFVETKRPKDSKINALQIWWRNKLLKLGFECWTVWDHNDLATFLEYITNKEN